MPVFRSLILWTASAAILFGHASAGSHAARVNQPRTATVGLIAGEAGSTDACIAADLAQVLNNDRLRVLPIQGSGSTQNLADLFVLKGIDVAIVYGNPLMQALRDHTIPKTSAVRYIANLFQEEVHVLARNDIAKLADLNDKPVAIGSLGSDGASTANTLFTLLRVNPSYQYDNDTTALDRLRLGQIAALVIVGGEPVPLLQTLGADSGLHFLPVPLNAALLDHYLPTKLDHQRYPNLVPLGKPVDTVAAGAVLVTLAMPAGSARADRVNRFVKALFGNFDRLRQLGRHPKWREVSLSAQIPGLTRYPEAQALLDKAHDEQAVSLDDRATSHLASIHAK